MEKKELEVLRTKVAAEPLDERGALSRALLAEVDRLTEVLDGRERAAFIQTVQHTQHLSEEEATRFVDWIHLHPTDLHYEKGPCRACGGKGSDFEPGCIGGHWEKCKHCHGRRTVTRLRLPWEPPAGPEVDLGLSRAPTPSDGSSDT